MAELESQTALLKQAEDQARLQGEIASAERNRVSQQTS